MDNFWSAKVLLFCETAKFFLKNYLVIQKIVVPLQPLIKKTQLRK
jgi:hypothetical protein